MTRLSFQIATVILTFGLVVAVTGNAHAQRRGGGPPQPDYDAFYELGPDSLVRRGVPKGRVEGPFRLATAVYPGVEHEYWVFVPAQYDGTIAASCR